MNVQTFRKSREYDKVRIRDSWPSFGEVVWIGCRNKHCGKGRKKVIRLEIGNLKLDNDKTQIPNQGLRHHWRLLMGQLGIGGRMEEIVWWGLYSPECKELFFLTAWEQRLNPPEQSVDERHSACGQHCGKWHFISHHLDNTASPNPSPGS